MIRHALQDDQTDIIDTWLRHGGNINIVSKSSGSLLHSVYLGSSRYCENIDFLLQRGKNVPFLLTLLYDLLLNRIKERG